jgi:hypothetical protein
MSNFRFCLAAISAGLMFGPLSNSWAQTYYSYPIETPIMAAPMNTSVNSPIYGDSGYNSPVYSSPVVGAPVVNLPYVSSPSVATSWQPYSPAPMQWSSASTLRGQPNLTSYPVESFDGRTLYLHHRNGRTTQRRTAWGQANYYEDRAHTQAHRQWQARTRQALPNNPLLRLGANVFLGPIDTRNRGN